MLLTPTDYLIILTWFLLGFVPLILMIVIGSKKPIPIVLPDDNPLLEKERLEAVKYHTRLLRIFIIPAMLCFAIATYAMSSTMPPGIEWFALVWFVVIVHAYLPKTSSNHVIEMIEKLKGMRDDYDRIERELVNFFIDFDVTEHRLRVLAYLKKQEGVLGSVATNLYGQYYRV